MLMSGPPGSGKSMLASTMPGILPPLSPREALEVTMIHSLGGHLPKSGLIKRRPYRDPHHSASLPALIGGGQKARPGEISLAHRGVLFLDELPEFARGTLESLRQPLETGEALVARVHSHVRYPARFQLIAAMNPCRCGYLGDAEMACNKAPRCGADYQSKISGPLLDRIDIKVDVSAVSISEMQGHGGAEKQESSADVAARVQAVRDIQAVRFKALEAQDEGAGGMLNAYMNPSLLEKYVQLDDEANALIQNAASQMGLSARGYHRVLRVARTIADLALREVDAPVLKAHVSEALAFRPVRV